MTAFVNIIPFIFIYAVLTCVVKFLWGYLVREIFPGAVEQNLIAGEISWKISLILAVLIFIVSG